MFKNLSKILFMFMVFIGSIITISSNSWLGLWMGLEINLLAFIPLMINKNNLNNSEAALNYFLTQAFASNIILFSIIMLMIFTNLDFFYLNYSFKYFFNMIIMMTIMLKLGAAPFHFWFPNVMENLNWSNNLILMTWQKLSPMMILSYLELNNLWMFFVMLSTLIGAMGGLNQISLRKLMAFSSINHIGWMIMALTFNESIWLMYFILYSFLNFSIIYLFKIFQIFYLNQMYSLFMNSYFLKFYLMTSILSLGGLPPFLGFLPKWLIIQSLMFLNLNLITLFLISMSLITLFYYLKISFAAYMLNYNELNWNFKNYFNSFNKNFMMIMNMSSLLGFFLIINVIKMV